MFGTMAEGFLLGSMGSMNYYKSYDERQVFNHNVPVMEATEAEVAMAAAQAATAAITSAMAARRVRQAAKPASIAAAGMPTASFSTAAAAVAAATAAMSGSSSKSSSTCSSPRSFSSYSSSSTTSVTSNITSSTTSSCAESQHNVSTKGIVLLGIPSGTTRRALADIFDKYGPVVNVQILPPVTIQGDQATRAVVDFATCKGAAAALQACGAEGTTTAAAATPKTTASDEQVEMVEAAWVLGPRMSFNGVQVAVVPKTQEWNAKLESGAGVIKRERDAGKAGERLLGFCMLEYIRRYEWPRI